MFTTLRFGIGAANYMPLDTYSSITIREDLADAENLITPTETPFMSTIAGKGPAATKQYVEWPLLALQPVDSTNRVIEGLPNPPVDNSDVAARRGNYTQISDKVVSVSDTSQQVDGAANIEKISKQIAYKLKELKRDKETMITGVALGVAGASGATARSAAGLQSWIMTNYSAGAGSGAPPALSSAAGSKYPATAPVAGTPRALSEDLLNTAIQGCWVQGGTPRYVLCSPINKRLISKTFTGSAATGKFQMQEDKKIITAVNFYESDFGVVQIVPDRFTPGNAVFVLDPDYVDMVDLQPTRQLELARTGHAENRLIQSEYTLKVGNEAAHACIADTQG